MRLARVMALSVLLAVQVACGAGRAPTPTAPVETLPEGVTAIRNGTVIDGTGSGPIADRLVAIKGREIVAVGAEAQYHVPQDAEVINAQGGSILPGFIDAHTHILGNNNLIRQMVEHD